MDLDALAAARRDEWDRLATLGSKSRLSGPEADELIAAYQSGAGTLSDALDARHTQLEADLQVLNLEREVSLVWAQLEYQVLPPDMTSGQ